MSNSIEAIGGPGGANMVRRITDMLDLMTQAVQPPSGGASNTGSDLLQPLASLLMQVLGNAAKLLGGGQEGTAGAGAAGPQQDPAAGKQNLALQAALLQMLGTLMKTVADVLQPGAEQPLLATPTAQGVGQGLGQPGAPASAGPTPPSPGAESPGTPTTPSTRPAEATHAPTPAEPATSPATPGDQAPAQAGAAGTTPQFSIPDVGSGGDLSPSQIASTYGREIQRASDASGIDPSILAGMIWQESKGRPGTPNGGLMQVGPHEFETYGGGDVSNAGDNIMAGAMYMKELKAQFGSTEAALRAYNSGPNGVDPNDFRATPKGTGDPTYVDKVLQAAEKSGL
ncbi:transglycosylase SLT domain-containing protein [Schlegelella sp. S2-27]|uniref:Transglycosylase SLT domain-containing protein n=1 Tax=Caldimonas mangrovi TaxID=2944811 RepID=A0ABT0YNV8_9BURK|nr:transglycosylase SLT domain-containing protein [Caldimonas mangrovi]MCM5679563.1 transglycosylase SLT domain-containing protein [Caldimonas mangrovi]